ncbi:MAG: queuosine precursor transporter [Eubacteriales bacterium]
MPNEIILILSMLGTYAAVLIAFYLFGRSGLYAWTAFATITANIEVMVVVDGFGMEQSLGNILFASTFLASDILSECFGKNAARKSVGIGVFASFCFMMVSQSWFLYQPSENDWAQPELFDIFSNTPRLLFVGLAVYAIAQLFDVWFYHFIWEKTEKKFGDSSKGLWIRNNGSTLCSQLLNAILFTFGAFYGVFDMGTLISILCSSYLIYVVTSLLDTPAVYFARKMKTRDEEQSS